VPRGASDGLMSRSSKEAHDANRLRIFKYPTMATTRIAINSSNQAAALAPPPLDVEGDRGIGVAVGSGVSGSSLTARATRPAPLGVGVCVGIGVGVYVGVYVGAAVGVWVGVTVCVGTAVGVYVGTVVGMYVGTAVGVYVGAAVGVGVGVSAGTRAGMAAGSRAGMELGSRSAAGVGVAVGVAVGTGAGTAVGAGVGTTLAVGIAVGAGVETGVAVGTTVGTGVGTGVAVGTTVGAGVGIGVAVGRKIEPGAAGSGVGVGSANGGGGGGGGANMIGGRGGGMGGGGRGGGGEAIADTMTEKVKAAALPFSSIAVQVYTVRSVRTRGVPLTRYGVVVARITPAGSAGASVYVNVPSPPLANGSVNGDICWRWVQFLSLIVCRPNVGTPSTLTSNVRDAVLPTASSTVQRYSVLALAMLGVPLTSRVVRFHVTPVGSAGLNVYVNVPSPPLADGNVNESISRRCTQLLSPIV